MSGSFAGLVLRRSRRRAFTLVEVLIVVAILAILVALLAPMLGSSRAAARRAVCQSNLRQLLIASHAYSNDNYDCVVPSYNMRGTTVGANNPLDGWGPILHAGRYAAGGTMTTGHVYVCPDTRERAGLAAAQTGLDPENPKGYMDWPAVLTLSNASARPLPERGFPELVRVGYWINAENPIGVPRRFTNAEHFSASVGYGPNSADRIIVANRQTAFREPARLIALTDGLYAGNQEVPRSRQRDSRVGYRHGRPGAPECNAGLADGHAESIASDKFPRKWVTGIAGLRMEDVRLENLGSGPTVYADPRRSLGEGVTP